jgi:hypothetical protein
LTSFVQWQEAESSVHFYLVGRWADAFAQADGFIEAGAGRQHYMDSVALWVRGAISFARGENEGALADARRATELARAIKDPQALHPALAFQGHVELAVGRPEAAKALSDELLAIWRGSRFGGSLETFDGACLLAGIGRADELKTVIEESGPRTPWHEGALQIASGDFAAAAETYAEMGSVPHEVYARLRAGTEVQLRLALPVLAELGATGWQAEAESLLAASA